TPTPPERSVVSWPVRFGVNRTSPTRCGLVWHASTCWRTPSLGYSPQQGSSSSLQTQMLLQEVDGPRRCPTLQSPTCRHDFAGYLEGIHLFFQHLAEQGMMNADPLVGDLGVHRV